MPLHIFEPRYREMMRDALSGDGLIVIGTFKPGWEASYYGRPALEPVAGLGQIRRYERLPDGRYNIVLKGLHRVRIHGEAAIERAYRVGDVEAIRERPIFLCVSEQQTLRDRITRLASQILCSQIPDGARVLFDHLVSVVTPLGSLTDVIAGTIDLPHRKRYELLTELDPVQRAHNLTRVLVARSRALCKSAPHFLFPNLN